MHWAFEILFGLRSIELNNLRVCKISPNKNDNASSRSASTLPPASQTLTITTEVSSPCLRSEQTTSLRLHLGKWNLLSPEFCLRLSQRYSPLQERISPESLGENILVMNFIFLPPTEALYMTITPVPIFFHSAWFHKYINSIRSPVGPWECHHWFKFHYQCHRELHNGS